MGTADGKIYLFDPELPTETEIRQYNYTKASCTKEKKVDLIKWYEEATSGPQAG